MAYLATNGLPIIEENEATDEIAEIFDEVKRELQIPFVPNSFKVLATSPDMLAFFWKIWHAYFEYTTLPQSLVTMIHYTIATKNNCTYCSANNEFACRTLGVDEETLDNLVKDLGSVTPQRIQTIIEFALKVAKDAQGLVRADYEKVRNQGVTDGELVEIMVIASFAKFLDTLADAVQLEVEPVIKQALDEMR
jgi:uncharacterized peroxidase-related enzyme